jgi:hypothetical protein
MAEKKVTTANDNADVSENESAVNSADNAGGPDAIEQFNDADLRSLTSFDDAIALIERTYGDVLDAAEEIGTGFVKLENKNRLLGVPFVILNFTPSVGDFVDDNGQPQYFVAVRLMTSTGEKLWFTDGGTGIYRQLEDLHVRSNRNGGIYVREGLRVSQYKWVDDKGNEQPGETFYLNV